MKVLAAQQGYRPGKKDSGRNSPEAPYAAVTRPEGVIEKPYEGYLEAARRLGFMKPLRVPSEEAVRKCAGCGKTIAPETPVFGLRARKRPGVDLSECEGQAIRMPMATRDRDVIVLVPTEGSDAGRDGWDFMFITCSERCASTMKAVMEEEVLLGTVLFGKIEKKGT